MPVVTRMWGGWGRKHPPGSADMTLSFRPFVSEDRLSDAARGGLLHLAGSTAPAALRGTALLLRRGSLSARGRASIRLLLGHGAPARLRAARRADRVFPLLQ